jgi:hypothetical protein
MHPLAERLASTFRTTFHSADQQITWQVAEEERLLWLTPQTALVGRVDARGLTVDSEAFFGEWKTLSSYKGRYIEDEKIKWRTDPQALTYGVLVPETHLFLVRWAIKPNDRKGSSPRCEFEWYTYNDQEVEHWRTQLIQIADEIRWWRTFRPNGPWRTNFGSCFSWGLKYACPFYDKCKRQAWGEAMDRPREESHLKIENKMRGELDKLPPDLVILDASRTGDFLACPESYRRKWEGPGYNETSEALVIGTDFHSLIAQHIRRLMPTTNEYGEVVTLPEERKDTAISTPIFHGGSGSFEGPQGNIKQEGAADANRD